MIGFLCEACYDGSRGLPSTGCPECGLRPTATAATQPEGAIITAEIIEVVRKCGEQFRFYEKNHRAKEPPQHDKADVNQVFAVMCEQAALRASGPAAGQWRDIASAPRDGTRFLAYQPSDEYTHYECWWQDDFAEWSGWQNDWDNEPSPTHWQPLPTPPALPATEE